MKRHWRFLHSSRLDQVFKCSSSCKINDLLRDEDVDREDVDRENKDSFTRLAGRDVPSESESLVELEVALELELGQLDDEYHLDFDLRFFDPSYAFGQVFLQLFQVCVFFRLNCRSSSCQANFSSVAVSPDYFRASLLAELFFQGLLAVPQFPHFHLLKPLHTVNELKKKVLSESSKSKTV